ncbi:MAG TPA: DUF5719 family protein [Streptosporangiaceae bacterium]|jgi:hypothetical protein
MVSRKNGGMLRSRVLPAVAVVVGLAAAYGLATVASPSSFGASAQFGQASQASVTSATMACPAPGSAGATAASLVTLAAPGSGSSQGSATVTRLTGIGSAGAGASVGSLSAPGVLRITPVKTAPKPPAAPKPKRGRTKKGTASSAASTSESSSATGSASAVPVDPGRGGVMVQASGALAQGLAAEQTGPGGLVTAACPASGTDFWFAGPGVSAAAQIELYLMNTGGQPTDVAVDALTDAGPLLGSADTGIVVPPHGIVTQSLGKLLHGSRVIALHVSTSVGQVAAAVRESKSSADPGGWLLPAGGPAKSMVIPGLPSSSGSRVIYIAVPGTGSAQVKLTAVTAKGSYPPTGGSGIDLAGDSVVAVQLPSMSGVAAAIKITSNVPVAAAAMVSGGASGAPGAFTATAAPVSEQGIAAGNPPGKSGSTELVISAPKTAATVRVATATAKTALSGDGGKEVQVAAGHSVVVRVKSPAKNASFSVVVTPEAGSGPVYVARVITSGGVIQSIMPLVSALTWVPLPPARGTVDTAGG